MEYGPPCGGVRDDLICEMAARVCPFAASAEVVAWTGEDPPAAPSSELLATAGTRPVVLTDLTVRPFDAGTVVEVSRTLAGSCDALLVGEHQGRPNFPPALMSDLIRDAGAAPWITLSCRDSNRVVLATTIRPRGGLDRLAQLLAEQGRFVDALIDQQRRFAEALLAHPTTAGRWRGPTRIAVADTMPAAHVFGVGPVGPCPWNMCMLVRYRRRHFPRSHAAPSNAVSSADRG
jgi:hypothetical protein